MTLLALVFFYNPESYERLKTVEKQKKAEKNLQRAELEKKKPRNREVGVALRCFPISPSKPTTLAARPRPILVAAAPSGLSGAKARLEASAAKRAFDERRNLFISLIEVRSSKTFWSNRHPKDLDIT